MNGKIRLLAYLGIVAGFTCVDDTPPYSPLLREVAKEKTHEKTEHDYTRLSKAEEKRKKKAAKRLAVYTKSLK